MTREDALRWMDIETPEFPLPKRAACVGCPFHNASVWVELDALVPDETDKAAAVEKAMIEAIGTEQYLHRRATPLREAIEADRLKLAVVVRETDDCDSGFLFRLMSVVGTGRE